MKIPWLSNIMPKATGMKAASAIRWPKGLFSAFRFNIILSIRRCSITGVNKSPASEREGVPAIAQERRSTLLSIN